MKRTIAGLLALTVLAIPASAFALDTAADAVAGKKANGFEVSFKFQKSGGEPVTVSKFRFKNLKMNCDQGKVLLTTKKPGAPDMAVTNDHFEGNFTNGSGGNIHINGDFNNKATKVEGNVSADGTFPNSGGGGNFTGCDGSKNYTAK